MAQRTTPVQTPEVEDNAGETTGGCCHHWVIQPAEGPVSDGSCQVCGETREFKNYVESATWGDSRSTVEGSSATADSTSDDEDTGGTTLADDDPEPDIEPDSSDLESED